MFILFSIIACFLGAKFLEFKKCIENYEKIEKIDLRHGDLPDPLSITISTLDKRIKELEKQLLNKSTVKKDNIEIYFGEYGDGI